MKEKSTSDLLRIIGGSKTTVEQKARAQSELDRRNNRRSIWSAAIPQWLSVVIAILSLCVSIVGLLKASEAKDIAIEIRESGAVLVDPNSEGNSVKN